MDITSLTRFLDEIKFGFCSLFISNTAHGSHQCSALCVAPTNLTLFISGNIKTFFEVIHDYH